MSMHNFETVTFGIGIFYVLYSLLIKCSKKSEKVGQNETVPLASSMTHSRRKCHDPAGRQFGQS